jgi:hypothetical protein
MSDMSNDARKAEREGSNAAAASRVEKGEPDGVLRAKRPVRPPARLLA